MKKYISCLFCMFVTLSTFSQNTGIGTATPAARLEVKGSGTTSATTSFQVINNADVPLLNVKDNGDVQVLNGNLNLAGPGPLKIAGTGGTAGQILTSNGGSAQPYWQTTQTGFSAYLTTNQNISPSVYTLVAPYTIFFDDGSGLNTTTGGYAAPSAGLYHFTFRASWAIASGSVTAIPSVIRAFKNGSVITGGQATTKIDVNTNYGESVEINFDVKLLASDIVTVQIFQNSGVAMFINGSGSSATTTFSGYKVY